MRETNIGLPPNARANLRASQIKGAGEARANPQIARQVQRSLDRTAHRTVRSRAVIVANSCRPERNSTECQRRPPRASISRNDSRLTKIFASYRSPQPSAVTS